MVWFQVRPLPDSGPAGPAGPAGPGAVPTPVETPRLKVRRVRLGRGGWGDRNAWKTRWE